jgi:hypothetical protein
LCSGYSAGAPSGSDSRIGRGAGVRMLAGAWGWLSSRPLWEMNFAEFGRHLLVIILVPSTLVCALWGFAPVLFLTALGLYTVWDRPDLYAIWAILGVGGVAFLTENIEAWAWLYVGILFFLIGILEDERRRLWGVGPYGRMGGP